MFLTFFNSGKFSCYVVRRLLNSDVDLEFVIKKASAKGQLKIKWSNKVFKEISLIAGSNL